MDYDCAADTVRGHMWKKSMDCNGDGVVTCEDYILIHWYGQTRCSDNLGVAGDSLFVRHRPCLRNMMVHVYTLWRRTSKSMQ